MTDWRITVQNPVRQIDGLDHERCAALHNLILEHGWQQSGRELDDLDRRTWWDLHEASVDPAIINDDVISFLKVAQEGYAEASPGHCFQRYLAGLSLPDQLHNNVMYGPDEDDSNKRRYITLYMANPYLQSSHPLGVVYDQETHRAIQLVSLDDGMIAQNGRQQWLPLEEILEAYLQMMDEKKVIAVDDDYEGDQDRAEPWLMPSYTETDLQEAFTAWNQLVEEVERRMGLEPLPSDAPRGLPAAGYLLDQVPERSFLRRFVENARPPRFTFLAPGLRLAQQQPFAEVPAEDDLNRPSLLLESGEPAHRETDRAPWGQDLPAPLFHPNFQRAVTRLPAGLYLTESNPSGAHPFEDGVKLLLPYSLGARGFARRSDGSLLGEDLLHRGPTPRTHVPRSAQLYQLGFNAYIEMHDVQLRRVLARWVEMVREGKWEVDAEGVAGGIEKWRDADTEEGWRDYVLPRTW
ncbi:hypothetical protein DV736_g6557, partial [Chaetothyriales sp. CBS 134916]